MADLCTAATNPSGCGHYNITATVGGVSTSVHVSDSELQVPLTEEDRTTLLLLNARVLRQSGVMPSQFVNRVLRGDEATNVKLYDIIGPGVAATLTNMGGAAANTYVNVLPGTNAQRVLVDFTGCTQYRLILNANLAGAGAYGLRVIRDSDSTVLHEATGLTVGERELDTDWQTIPGAFSGQTLVRLQARSATTTDDPVFRRCSVLVR